MHRWPDVLFVDNPELYLPFLERDSLDVEKEVDGICSILRDTTANESSKILDLACGIGRHDARDKYYIGTMNSWEEII